MQGHSAPLGVTFYHYTEDRPMECGGIIPFPSDYDKYAFIAFHGSWNRDIPTGYKVVYVPFDLEGNSIEEPIDLLAHAPPNAAWEDGFRPVDVDFDACGRLIVTSDGTDGRGSKVIYIQYAGSDEFVSTSPPNASPHSTNSSSPSSGYTITTWKMVRVTLALMFTFLGE
jgi:glucose/arabinose dehydrogenase